MSACEGTVTVKVCNADVAAVTGGGSATDLVKVTVSGVVGECDARDHPIGKALADCISFAVAASMRLVLGSELS